MYYKRKDLPAENEIVVCTVTKILHNSVFAKLDEFENIEGMIHISEIAPGRIRNIRDYVKENKKIICKIIKAHKEKRHYDLSLRRVSLSARKAKNNEIKQEIKAEKLLERIAKQLKKDPKKLYNEIAPKIIEKYGFLHTAFLEIVNNKDELKNINIDKEIKRKLIETVKERIKQQEVTVKSILKLTSKASNGIELIKKTIEKAEILAKQKNYKFKIMYIGAPKYEVIVNSKDYKKAEKSMEEINNMIIKEIKSQKGEAEWQKKS